MRKIIAYKVVTRLNSGKLCSFNAKSIRSVDGLEYKPGQLVKPRVKNSKLFAFNNLENAKELNIHNTEIWKCEIYNPERTKRVPFAMGVPSHLEKKHLEKIWKQNPKDKNCCFKGTILGDAIRLIEKVK